MGKRFFNWQVISAFVLILLSAIFYWISYKIFHDAHYIFMTILDNIGFAFFEVFLVTLVIHRLLLSREKKALLMKLNMVIGTFFIEAGTELLHIFSKFDPQVDDITKKLASTKKLSDKEFDAICRDLRAYECTIDYGMGDIEGLRNFLTVKRGFFLTLLENPNLLEHDSFTDLLWATFHLADELSRRKDLRALAVADCQHLAGDISRAYCAIIGEWLAYMKHLKVHYPYLFSLAMRTNPFDFAASVELSSY